MFNLRDYLIDGMERTGLKAVALAAKLDVPPEYISQWKTGRGRPGPEKMRALASAFGDPPDFLVAQTMVDKAIEAGLDLSLLCDVAVLRMGRKKAAQPAIIHEAATGTDPFAPAKSPPRQKVTKGVVSVPKILQSGGAKK